jgi:Plasmid encoded RepA protein
VSGDQEAKPTTAIRAIVERMAAREAAELEHDQEERTPPTPEEATLNMVAAEQDAADAWAAGTVGFLARPMVQATLPHDRVEGTEYLRRNGRTVLVASTPSVLGGVPFGGLPRLVICQLYSRAVVTGRRQIEVGRSRWEYQGILGLGRGGGPKSSARTLDEHLVRLTGTQLLWVEVESATGPVNPRTITSVRALPRVLDAYARWWNPKADARQQTLEPSMVELSEEFFELTRAARVPLDLRLLTRLHRSPLAMDLYCALTHRVSYLREDATIPWHLLMQQFGAGYSGPRGVERFRVRALGALRRIGAYWRGLRWEERPDADGRRQLVLLKASRPHVPLQRRLVQVPK